MLLEQRYIFRILLEILLTFDLSDEVGRQTLKNTISSLLTSQNLDEPAIQKLILCTEALMPHTETRLNFTVENIVTIFKPEEVAIDFSDAQIKSFVDRIVDQNEKIRLMQLELKILEFREKIISADGGKYVDELATSNKEFLTILINNVIPQEGDEDVIRRLGKAAQQHEISSETTIKCLQICFYAVESKKTKGLAHSMCQLFKVSRWPQDWSTPFSSIFGKSFPITRKCFFYLGLYSERNEFTGNQ